LLRKLHAPLWLVRSPVSPLEYFAAAAILLSDHMTNRMRIVVVEPDRARALEIIDALKDGGWDDVTVLADVSGLARKLHDLAPDLLLIDLANSNRDALEQVSVASSAETRPVAMFVDHSDDEMTQAAVAAGLSAYVVGDMTADRIKRRELEAAKQALADRKTLDRAKGMLMRAHGVSEEKAYSLLRKTAMDQNRKVVDVAHALLTAADLLK